MSCDIKTWNAHVHEADGKRTLHVTGEGECTSSGHTLSLERTNEGIIDNPDVIAIALKIDEPEVGADVITPETVEGIFEIGGDPATRVEIRGAASVSVPIE